MIKILLGYLIISIFCSLLFYLELQKKRLTHRAELNLKFDALEKLCNGHRPTYESFALAAGFLWFINLPVFIINLIKKH